MASTKNLKGQCTLLRRIAHTKTYERVTLSVPTTEDNYELPSIKLAKGKPTVKIPKHTADLESMYKALVLLHLDLSVELVLAFLSKWMLDIKEDSEEIWTSYDIEIGHKGITPLDLLKPYDGPKLVFDPVDTRDPTPEQINGLACLLLSGSRMETAEGQGKDDYRERLVTAIRSQAKAESIIGILEKTPKLMLDKNYSTLCAAFDMYMTKFPSNRYAGYRVGTISTCYKDSAGLGLISAFSSKIGKPNSVAASMIFNTPAIEELDKYLDGKEEITESNSYLPYCRSMSIVEKSPYSITRCRNLHAYIMMYLALSGDRRGMNARLIQEINSDAILKIVINLHRYLQTETEVHRRFFTAAEDFDSHFSQESEADPDADHASSFGLQDYASIRSEAERAYRAVKRTLTHKNVLQSYANRLIKARDGTMGAWVMTSLQALSLAQDTPSSWTLPN